MKNRLLAIVCSLFISVPVYAGTITTTMYKLESNGTIGPAIGTITFQDSTQGLQIVTNLKGLPSGSHGFHIHENPNCGATEQNGTITPGGQAGGHYDPNHTKKHAGYSGNGHLGDLPALVVTQDGTAKETLYAPRLKTSDIKNRSVMIHAGGDNYSDTPLPLGGGGARISCGVIK